MSVVIRRAIGPPNRPSFSQRVLGCTHAGPGSLTGIFVAVTLCGALVAARGHQLARQGLPDILGQGRVAASPEAATNYEILAVRRNGMIHALWNVGRMPPSRVSELHHPVNALKADWLVASSWIGFTPQGKGADAVARCQSAINEQMRSGYIVEYITKHIDTPNKGFENDPEHLKERELHAENAGRLIAVHRLRHSPRPLREIIKDGPYERLQDMWATGSDRRRWSVAFPSWKASTSLTGPWPTKCSPWTRTAA